MAATLCSDPFSVKVDLLEKYRGTNQAKPKYAQASRKDGDCGSLERAKHGEESSGHKMSGEKPMAS
jgi:hypothetical protein